MMPGQSSEMVKNLMNLFNYTPKNNFWNILGDSVTVESFSLDLLKYFLVKYVVSTGKIYFMVLENVLVRFEKKNTFSTMY